METGKSAESLRNEEHGMLKLKSHQFEGLINFYRHNFNNKEKRAYIDAELCLMKKPAGQKISRAVTRFDELQGIHQVAAFYTHYVVGLARVLGQLPSCSENVILKIAELRFDLKDCMTEYTPNSPTVPLVIGFHYGIKY